VFLAGPLAKVDEFAAFATKRSPRIFRRPLNGPLTRWTAHLRAWSEQELDVLFGLRRALRDVVPSQEANRAAMMTAAYLGK
jgi:hypothetical protein